MSTPIRYDKPIAYNCCSCKEFFEAEDAIHDHLLGEGYLDICPRCGSEDLEDLYELVGENNDELAAANG